MINKRTYEIFMVLGLCIFIYVLSVYYDLAERLFHLSMRYEYLQFDEFFIFLLITGCGVGFLGVRQMEALRREVTERKRVEAALKESEQYTKALFQSMHTALVVFYR